MMTNTYLPHVGGVARSVQTFTEEFRRNGHKVLVVAPTFSNQQPSGEIEKGVVRLPAIQRFNGSDFSIRLPLTALFNQQIDRFGAHLIHSHHPFLIGDTALRIAASKHVPVIFTHHTLYEEYTHYVPIDSPMLRQFVIELCTEYANLCDAVIAPSQSIASLIQERGVEAPIEIIPTGVDAEALAGGNRSSFRKALGISPNMFVIGHVGRLAPEKNLGYLARAVCAALDRLPQAAFLVVGSGPSEEEVRSIFSERGLDSRLHLAGVKTGSSLCDAYAAMDVFVFSSFSETQGLVLAEAMAAGVPVIALDAPGVREIVRDGENGFLLDGQAEVAEFAACLTKVQSRPALRNRLSAGARLSASELDRSKCAARALALYQSVRRRTRTRRQREKRDVWTALLKRIELEWDLIAEKTTAAVRALSAERKDGHAA